MIKAIIVDDEKHAHERFHRIVKDIPEIQILGDFYEGRSALNYIKSNSVDCAFLDIEMPESNGLTIANQILDIDPEIDIIFITAFQQYAVQAFELNAIDYLLKPITVERLKKTFNRLLSNKQKSSLKKTAEIICFGAFCVKADGIILHWKNQRAKELLAFLVHKNGVPVNWDQITEALWHNLDKEKAQVNFHTTMYRLKKNLAFAGIEYILIQKRGNYAIKRNQINCDFFYFRDTGKLPRFYQRYMDGEGFEWAEPFAVEIDKAVAIKKDG